VKNPLLQKWENKLQNIFDHIDHILEKKYGGKFRLKPNRPPHNQGVTPDTDGLFELGVSFSTGFGSEFGPGYVFQIRIATNEHIPNRFKKRVENEVVELLETKLPEAFPDRKLQIAKDGRVYKIYGDLDLN
jgi:hypothetical protein